MANYFNSLPLRLQLEQLGVCEFMDQSEFANGIEALAGKKVVIVGCGAQGLNQGLNMRDSGLNISYALRAEAITENTRVSYPLHYISNALEPAVGGLPKNIFFLTCDATGVLPPISRLTKEQAMYQFISGYTAKVAGTEAGVTEPKSTFSACFGAPFLPLHPGKYAEMLSLSSWCRHRMNR